MGRSHVMAPPARLPGSETMHPSNVNAGSTVSGPPRQSFDASLCKTGDRLLARITGVASSGRTVLNIGGVTAVAAKSLGGRVGEHVLLEVAARGTQAAPSSGPGDSQSQGPAARQEPLFEIVVHQRGRFIRLKVRLQAAASRATASAKGATHQQTLSKASGLTMLATIQTTLPERSAQAISAWCDVLRKRLQPMTPPGARGTVGYDRPSTRSERMHRNPGDTGERPVSRGADMQASAADGCCAGGYFGEAMVRLRLGRKAHGSSQGTAEQEIEAVFVLVLEQVGAVRTDLRMGSERLSVRFFVETEDCRQRFAEALADLERALSRWGCNCRCRVAVAPREIEAFWREEGVSADGVLIGEEGVTR